MPYDPEEGWEALVQEVVALWTSGQREAALLRLGGIAQHVCTTRNADDGNDAPPAWLVHDGALEELGPPARAAWLLTAFAILGESLGLVPAQVELALARARVAAAAAHTTLRHEAAAFLVDQDDHPVEALQPLLLRRATAAVVAVQAGPAAAALRELLALFPEVVQSHAWLALELRAYEVVGARMQAGEEAAADALSAALSDVAEAQFESVRQGAAGLRALRGAFFVWLAERRFGTERHAEAMHALDAAAGLYAKVSTVHDLPQAQIPRLRGEDARRQKHPERAVAHFVEALRYLTEKYTGPRGLIVATLRSLSDVLFELGRHEESETILHRTLELVRDRPQDTALHAAVRGTVAVDLARIALEHARADRRDAVRARVTELHAFLSGLPPLPDADAVALLRQLGLLHERLGEHAAARGCYALCLARIGPRHRAWDGFFVRAALLYANSFYNTGDFVGLEAFVRDTSAALHAQSPRDEFAAKWSQAVADLLDELERFAAATPPEAPRPAAGSLSALARQLRALPPDAPAPPGLEAPVDALTERAAPWLAPIPGAHPLGESLRYDPTVEELVRRIAALDHAGGDEAAHRTLWRYVADRCDPLLRARSKDLSLTVYLAHAWHRLEGVDGLVRGLALVTGMLQHFGLTLHPQPMRPRRCAQQLAWLVERSLAVLDGFVAPRDALPALQQALALVQRLSELSRTLLGNDAPYFGGLRETLERHRFDAQR